MALGIRNNSARTKSIVLSNFYRRMGFLDLNILNLVLCLFSFNATNRTFDILINVLEADCYTELLL